ncbi:MAG: fibronectin type III domain-containing protein [bacterium]|nr:fibronectin type III domain-containing protein [bacterium]
MFKKAFAILVVVQMLIASVPSVFAQSGGVLRVMNITAGKPALIMLQGKPGEVVNLRITNPFKSTVTQKFQLDKTGVLQYLYSQAVIAGQYSVSSGDQTATFSVSAGQPDTQKSYVELSDYTAFTGEEIQGSLLLQDHYGNKIGQRLISIQTKGSAQISCAQICQTNAQGLLTFSVYSRNAGLVQLDFIDQKTGSPIFHEDIGFLPQVQQTVQQPFYNPYGQMSTSPYLLPTQPVNSFLPVQPNVANLNQLLNIPSNFQYQSSPSLDYIPVFDPTRATTNSEGGDDDGFFSTFSYDQGLNDFFGADLIGTPEAVAQSNGGTVDSFEIIFGDDPEGEFQNQVSFPAQSAQDFYIRAVDQNGAVVMDYTGEITFDISPEGPLLPPDYEFAPLDQGVTLFELALVLPAGEYTLKVEDTLNSSIEGEVEINALLGGAPTLNNTNIELILDSPVSGSVYTGTIAVQGSTNTENTEVIVKEGDQELARAEVDNNRGFNFPIVLADGSHHLEIIANYLPDGSQTTTTVNVDIDQTPPVIISVDDQIDPVRAGDNFTMRVEAEAESKLEAIIDNRTYEFTNTSGTSYELTAKSPLTVGDYAISLKIADELGNSDSSPDVATLSVLEPLKEIENLFGIPGVESLTLSWNPVEGAVVYEIEQSSILGTMTYTSTEPRTTIEKLQPETSYKFKVLAKDAAGESISLVTETRALKVLAAPAEEVQPTVSAAPETPTPSEQPKSGPEVYLLILASVILLNFYSKLRKKFCCS